MSEENRNDKRDRLESLVTLIGIMGGVIAVFSGVYQLWQGNIQTARELRWKQAEMAREMVSKGAPEHE